VFSVVILFLVLSVSAVAESPGRLRPRGTTVAAHAKQRSATMGMFDGILGGVIGAEMATVVNGMIERHGGIGGIVNQFETNGLGPTVRSWVGPGANQPITPDQVHQGLGTDQVQALAAKLGIPTDQLAAKLAEVLPQSIDHLTPGGVIPAPGASPWGAPPS
jgi:uncharacterized protein YidB (DUF937 family)